MTAPTKEQMRLIHIKMKDKEQLQDIVRELTSDPEKTSLKDLDFNQANSILKSLGIHPFKPVRKFDSKNEKHRVIMNLLHDIGWQFYEKGNQYADLDRLGEWLITDKKSPVKKRYLSEMDNKELEKVIAALTGIFKWKANTNRM